MSAKELENEIALVTGASRGIGLAIALELGRQGATVIGTATSNDGAGKIGETLKAEGIKGQGLVLNVTDQGSIDTALTEIHNAQLPGISSTNGICATTC
jgi:3-oxoacyl-[acyl-carrier protein] reductase